MDNLDISLDALEREAEQILKAFESGKITKQDAVNGMEDVGSKVGELLVRGTMNDAMGHGGEAPAFSEVLLLNIAMSIIHVVKGGP